MTGISVGSEMDSEQQQRQKAVIEFNSDVRASMSIALSYRAEAPIRQNNWLTDLRPMIADKSLTTPGSTSPTSQGGLNYAVEPDGRVNSLPLNLDPWVVYYNKELFGTKGIAFPKTFAEMQDAASRLNDPGKGVSGFVARIENANNADVDKLSAWLRWHLRRCQRQIDDRHQRSDRGRQDV